jgi:hypothetical protein
MPGTSSEEGTVKSPQREFRDADGRPLAKGKSETRQLTELVAVRFAPADLDALREEASRREMSVPQLLREVTLGTLRTAS